MKTVKISIVLSLALMAGTACADSHASKAIEHSGQASKHTVLAAGDSVVAVGKVGSAVVAVPALVIGSAAVSVGTVLTDIGEAGLQHASSSSQSNAPLTVCDEVIVAGPSPAQAMTKSEHKPQHKPQ